MLATIAVADLTVPIYILSSVYGECVNCGGLIGDLFHSRSAA